MEGEEERQLGKMRESEGKERRPALLAMPAEAPDTLVKHLGCSRTSGAAQASANTTGSGGKLSTPNPAQIAES